MNQVWAKKCSKSCEECSSNRARWQYIVGHWTPMCDKCNRRRLKYKNEQRSRPAHYCSDWDDMWIETDTDEMECCLCNNAILLNNLDGINKDRKPELEELDNVRQKN